MRRYKMLQIKKFGNGYLVYSSFCKAICSNEKEVYETFLCYGKNEEEIKEFVSELLKNL